MERTIRPAPADAYHAMDATRAVLALLVTFGHAWVLIIRDYQPAAIDAPGLAVRALYGVAGLAHPAVMMFFVLSGYWIGRSVMGRADAGWSWRSYLLDRLTRLCVVLVPALAIGGLLDAAGLWLFHLPTHWGQTGAWVLHKDVGRDLSMATLAGNLLFLQGIAVRTFGSNGPLWSVAAEFWYYLWFPALYLLWRQRKAGVLLASLAVGAAAPLLVAWFPVWLCGAAVAALERSGGRGPTRFAVHRAFRAGAWLALAGALAAARLDGRLWDDWLLGVAFAGLLWAWLNVPRGVGAIGRAIGPLAKFGARASFSLYAIHFPVVMMVAGIGIGAERWAPTVPALALVAAAMLAAVAASLAFAWAFESRTARVRAWVHGLRTPSRAAGRQAGGLRV